MGSRWDRKGENEIDIITENELDNKLFFYEVKRKKEYISIGELKKKAEAFFTKNKIAQKYEIEYMGLTLEDM